MPTSQQFRKDLKRSQPLVDWVDGWFQSKGFKTSQTKGKAPYDLRATKVEGMRLSDFRVEVKFDEKSLETHNLCIERSSLDYSTADIFIIGTVRNAYILSLDQAKQLYHDAPDKRCVGDIPGNWCAIIPKSSLLNIPTIHGVKAQAA
jgi:hypothetical protein